MHSSGRKVQGMMGDGDMVGRPSYNLISDKSGMEALAPGSQWSAPWVCPWHPFRTCRSSCSLVTPMLLLLTCAWAPPVDARATLAEGATIGGLRRTEKRGPLEWRV